MYTRQQIAQGVDDMWHPLVSKKRHIVVSGLPKKNQQKKKRNIQINKHRSNWIIDQSKRNYVLQYCIIT